MKKSSIYLVVSIVCLLILGCSSEETTCSIDISDKISSIETVYGCSNTIESLALNEPASYLVIENKEKYDEQIVGDCHPEIDFNLYSLIIGNVVSENKISSLRYKLVKSCEPNFYKLYVYVKKDFSQISDENESNTYHILLPKDERIDYFKIFYVFNQN